jgi:iron complex outermembrane receptor protein
MRSGFSGRRGGVEGGFMGATALVTAMSAFAFGGADDARAHARLPEREIVEIVRSYQIPAGRMSTALNRLADASGVLIVYDTALTRALKTRGVEGTHTLNAALEKLLSGTELSYEVAADGKSVLIVLAQNDAGARSDAGGAEALPPIDVGAADAPAAATRRAGTRAAGEPKIASEGYVVRDASTATKGDIPLRETPITVNVVPKQVFRDQAITTLESALENVPGVRATTDTSSNYLYKVRGFTVSELFRNQVNPGYADFFTDLANVERIEVLKGPASILYGRAEPGGLINIVTKQPLFTPLYVVEQQIGNYDHYRTQWDISAPVAEAPGLAYRFSGAYQNSRVFRRFSDGERFLIAPVITYQPSADTEFTVDLQYMNNKNAVEYGIPTLPGAFAPAGLPTSRSFQEANEPGAGTDSFVGGYVFRQNLDENWKIVNRFLYSSMWFQQTRTTPSGFVDAVTMDRRVGKEALMDTAYSTNINVEGKFDTFGARHKFLFGLDYSNEYYDYYIGDAVGSYPINVFAPTYGSVPNIAYYGALIGAGDKYHSSYLARQKGMYVQDHVSLLDDKAHLLLGVRYDVADQTNGEAYSEGGDYSASQSAAVRARLQAPTLTDKAWSPRFGVVYEVTPEVSAYGSYSRSFGLNNARGAQVLAPQRGVQWEVGLKAQPLPEISATLAFFQLTKSNLATPNLETADPNDTILTGLQRSRGIELDILGRIDERFSVLANYAHIDAKVISANPSDPSDPRSGLLGNHLDNVPRHSGKVFLTYDLGENGLGWRIGGGVTASTHAWATIQNSFLLPSYARLDAFASYATSYEGHKVTGQINLNNITNARYFTGVYFSATPAPPFTVLGTLKFEW